MGWFSNPDCPQCGRETTIGTDGLEDYLECVPCRRKARRDREEKEDMKRRIAELEAKVSS